MCIVTVSCAYREGSVVGTYRLRIVYVSCMYRVRIVFKSYRLYRPTHRSRIVHVSFMYRLHILSSVSAQRIVYVSIMYRKRIVFIFNRLYRPNVSFMYRVCIGNGSLMYLRHTIRIPCDTIRLRYGHDT